MKLKEKMLLASACLVGVATLVGSSAAVLVESGQMAARMGTVGGLFALGSIGVFFIGLAMPKDA